MMAWLPRLFSLWAPRLPAPAAPATAITTPPTTQQQLEFMEEGAKTWAATLGTLTGLLAVVGVTVGPSALEKRQWLGTGFDVYWWGIALLLAILLTSVAATLLAVWASSPDLGTMSTDQARLEDERQRRIAGIHQKVRLSQWLMRGTVTALLAYAGLVLLSAVPKDPEPPGTPYSRVVTSDGVYCGVVVTGPEDKLQLHPRTGSSEDDQATKPEGRPLPGTVTEITPVTSCPPNAVPAQ